MSAKDIFSTRLRELRKEKKLTQQQLAAILSKVANTSIATTTISSYELADKQPTLDTLICLADFFNVSTDYLLGRTDTKKGQHTNSLKIDNIEKLEKHTKVYIHYYASTANINSEYSGVYAINGDKLMDDDGRILPQKGLNISFDAFIIE